MAKKELKQVRLFENKIVEDWDFADADTQYATHGLHPYPARMIPQIARRLIKRYLIEYLPPPHSQYIVFDPFCGSGTVLTEAKLLGVNAIGVDLNPLAVILAKTKSNPPDPKKVEDLLPEILKFDVADISEEDIKSKFGNISYWFKSDVIRELSKIKTTIRTKIVDVNIRNFFNICLSLTARKSSNIYREGDTYIKRMKPEELRKHNPNVSRIFRETIIEKLSDIKNFYNIVIDDLSNFSDVILANALSLCIAENTIDLIVTSPPYGEEKNTISYTRWSKISLYWLTENFDLVKSLEKATLGCKTAKKKIEDLPSKTLNEILEFVEKRYKCHDLIVDVKFFFSDYYKALRNMFNVLKNNRYCCIVIGNRSLKQERIPMDKVTVELAEHVGFRHEATFYRKIPTKALPWKCGKGETISKENIVILKKE